MPYVAEKCDAVVKLESFERNDNSWRSIGYVDSLGMPMDFMDAELDFMDEELALTPPAELNATICMRERSSHEALTAHEPS